MTFEHVGFIGLGGMGRGLVKNLVAKGVAVTAYDLNPAAVSVAQSFGATAANGVQEIRDKTPGFNLARDESCGTSARVW